LDEEKHDDRPFHSFHSAIFAAHDTHSSDGQAETHQHIAHHYLKRAGRSWRHDHAYNETKPAINSPKLRALHTHTHETLRTYWNLLSFIHSFTTRTRPLFSCKHPISIVYSIIRRSDLYALSYTTQVVPLVVADICLGFSRSMSSFTVLFADILVGFHRLTCYLCFFLGSVRLSLGCCTWPYIMPWHRISCQSQPVLFVGSFVVHTRHILSFICQAPLHANSLG